MNQKIAASAAAAALLAGLLSGCTPASEPSSQPAQSASPAPTETAAEKPYEGTTLNVMLAYGGAEASFDAFTEKTGIKVEYVEISTGKALAQLQAENGNTTADIWFGGGVDSYIAATDLGYLEQYVSPEAENINPAYSDKDGYWTGLALVPAGFLVNNDVLAERNLEAPKTWEDLAKPEYKGEIIMASPAISGTQYAILNGTIQAYGEEKGWEVWRGINENVDFYAQGGGEPGPKCAAGEFGIAVLAMTGGTFAMEDEFPVTALYPEDMIPWTPAPIAIFKSSENKEAAKVFVDYMLSKEGQDALREADARIMARSDVEIPAEIGNVDTSKLIEQDVRLFGSQREDLLAKWDALAGDKESN
ncbi:ABC transporter substrate-binding protein [Pseudoflavonifractor gallinarum]|uniref:ABC transporter substrate-binding protein n=1 Tax=Pseudoflavonifractor gallinarum TaxID=2779352 RepID=UPI0036F379CB